MAKNKQASKQYAEFKKTARELEVDESEEAFDKALRKVGRKSAGVAKKTGSKAG